MCPLAVVQLSYVSSGLRPFKRFFFFFFKGNGIIQLYPIFSGFRKLAGAGRFYLNSLEVQVRKGKW